MAQAQTTTVSLSETFQHSTIKDDKQFAYTLSEARKSVNEGFAMVQECVLYGLDKYLKHSADASYLSRALDLAIQLKGCNPNQLKEYIKEHANVVYRQATDGTKKFGKNGKGPAVVTFPIEGYFWWDQVSEAIDVKPDMVDPVAAIISLIHKLQKKEKAGKIPESRKEMFHELEAQLAPIMQLEPLPKDQLFSGQPTVDQGE